MSVKLVEVTIELPEYEAWAFAQFLKRSGWYDCANYSTSKEQTYNMVQGKEKVRTAFAKAGIAPR